MIAAIIGGLPTEEIVAEAKKSEVFFFFSKNITTLELCKTSLYKVKSYIFYTVKSYIFTGRLRNKTTVKKMNKLDIYTALKNRKARLWLNLFDTLIIC